MEAVIVGGTGLVGSLLIQELIRTDKCTKITSIGRRPVKSESVKVSNILINDLSEISKIELNIQKAIFFCCLGSTIKQAGSKENFRKVDYNGTLAFADLAKKLNASKFILVSAKGADPKSPFFYNKTKGEAERAITNLDLNSLTIFRPGLLLGDREEFRFFELASISIVRGFKSILGDNLLRPIVTPVNELVNAMIDDSLVIETEYKIVDSSEIKKNKNY